MSEPGEGPNPTIPQAPEISPQSIMTSIVARHNTLETKRDGNTKWNIDTTGRVLGLRLTDKGSNNQLAVAVSDDFSSQFAHIGHYDPGLGRFLFYPEVVTDTEAAVLDGLAKTKRDETVTENLKHDYDAKIIKDLRKKHREVLERDGLIGRIVNRYNHLPGNQKLALRDEVSIDDRTSYFVCLTPMLGGIDRRDPTSTQAENLFMTSEAFVSIALQGDYFTKNGVNVRRGGSYIHVGHLDLDSPQGYVPDKNLVTDEEFAQILELTHELQHLRTTTVPSLDTEFVALKR